MAKINLRGALAGLLIGASALTTGCATPKENQSKKVADFYSPCRNTPNTHYIAGDVLETRVVQAKNDRFQIDNKVYVPAHGARFGVYLVVDPKGNREGMNETYGYVISGSEEVVKNLSQKVSPQSSLVLKLPVAGRTAEYWRTEINGKEHSVHLEPLLNGWGILLPQKSSEQTLR